MNVLIACEESQTSCKAFRARGFRAFSCDIQPSSGGHPEWHVCGDALAMIYGDCEFVTEDGRRHTVSGPWDLIVAHPPCTYLTNAGIRHFNVARYGEKAARRARLRLEAAEFFLKFTKTGARHVAIENPIGYMNTHFRLPPLKRTSDFQRPSPLYTGKTGRGYSWCESLFLKVKDYSELAKARSKTFPGVAEAMAAQWGDFIRSGRVRGPYQQKLFPE